jgi:DivIVA domain-containing protein
MTRAHSETLTPDRVRSAVFSPTRLGRRGLDEGEVRAFCDWVSDGLGRLLSDNAGLQEEVMRLRNRLIGGRAGPQPEDAQVQAVHVLSRAQQTADRYVADAQEYSRELAQDAQLRRDEVLREAKMRASIILEEAHTAASRAASMVPETREPLPASERQELQAEIAYLRTFSNVCRTHLRAYMESLSRSIEQWEQVEREPAAAVAEARESALRSGSESEAVASTMTPRVPQSFVS